VAVLLEIKNASKHFGDQVLLDDASATITDEGKVGFVGRNGAGKSTLLRVILGEEELDRGEIIRHPRLKIGYLRQHDPFKPGETAAEFLMRDSGQPDWKCGEVAGQFELKGESLHGPIAALSGGWQTRVKLASLLLQEPNLLLLDEPTNFLDLRTQILLEHFLRSFKEACLIVSHDRAFLSATCSHTLDLTRGSLTMFPGKIEPFLEFQREKRDHQERTNATMQSKRKQLEDFIARNRARASTATRAKSKSKQLERMEIEELQHDEPTAVIRAPQVDPRKGPAVRCRNVSVGYPGREVACGIDVEIEHGSRAALVGDNGQGKTTFLRTIVDSLKPLRGDVRWGFGCQIGIYAQHVYTSLPVDQTVLGYLENAATIGTKAQMILDLAGAMLFRGNAVNKSVSVLSGGERARLCMAGLLLGPYNVLVLDEPGNHLDVDTVDALAESLIDYRGTVIFTSHDRYFLKRVATSIVEVRDGRVINYRGDYDSYIHMVNREIDEGERENKSVVAKSGGGAKNKNIASQTATSVRNDREVRKEITTVERSISKLDQEKKGLSIQFLAAVDPAESLTLHNEVAALTQTLAVLEERWLILQQELGE